MTTERRTDARGKATARVTFTDATSETPSEGELLDIGRGGMFVSTTKPLPVGKRIELEVHLEGAAAIAGMARVVWSREAAVGELPAGMGIKFIDVDNDALVAIDRLVGLKKNVRERTVLGIAAPTPPPAEKPVEAKPVKARERTMLGIAPPAQATKPIVKPAPVVVEPPREKELSWPEEPPEAPPEPVKVKEPEPEPVKESEPVKLDAPVPEPVPEPVKEPEPEPVKEPEPVEEPRAVVAVAVPEIETPKKKSEPSSPPPPRELPARESGGSGKWIVVVLLLVGAGVAAYFFRDQIMAVVSPAPSATVSAAPSASTLPLPSASASVPAPIETIDAAPAIVEPELDASTTSTDAGIHDAGHDGGDGGKHHHDAGTAGATSATHHAATTPKPKPSSSAAGSNDNPY